MTTLTEQGDSGWLMPLLPIHAIQIIHARADDQRAQVALAEAIGAKVWHDADGRTFVTHDDGRMMAERPFTIMCIPGAWREGPADPIGGWQANGQDDH